MTITLTFTVDEANYILNALAARPYAEVKDLIAKLQEEGAKQLQSAPQPEQQEAA